MADQFQNEKNKQDTGKPIQFDKDQPGFQSEKNKQDTGKPIQLDKDQRGGQDQQDKKPMSGQPQRPGQHDGAEHQGGAKK
jgi:hypothetical protein